MPASSRGFANILLIVAVVTAITIGGYFLLQKGSLPKPSIPIGGAPTLIEKASEKDFEFVEDPTLRKHFATQANQTTYSTKSTSPGSGLKLVNEVQTKSDSLNSSEIQNDGAKEIKHQITIGDTIYLKDYSDNKWWKQTIKPEKQKEEKEKTNQEKPKDFKEEYSKPNIVYKSLGKEACGPSAKELTCFKYEMQLDPANPEVKRTFWFDDKDYLLRKDQGGFGEFIATVEYSYDGINITAPSPTKDVPEGKNIYEYQSFGPNTPTPAIPETYQTPQIPPMDAGGTDY